MGIITFDQWKTEIEEKMNQFEDYWKGQDNKKLFPNEMNAGDWDEQFDIFFLNAYEKQN